MVHSNQDYSNNTAVPELLDLTNYTDGDAGSPVDEWLRYNHMTRVDNFGTTAGPGDQRTGSRPKSRNEFDIALICALGKEFDAVVAVCDEEWDDAQYGKAEGNPNRYSFGRIGTFSTVLVLLPGMGKEAAASVSAYFQASFPSSELCRVFSHDVEGDDIMLGDLVVSTSVVQSDTGRQHPYAIVRKNTIEDNFGRYSKEIRSVLNHLKITETGKSCSVLLPSIICKLCFGIVSMVWRYSATLRPPTTGSFTYPTPITIGRLQAVGFMNLIFTSELSRLRIKSCNQPPTATRDTVEDVIAYEMEGAGVWNNFRNVVITKSACDYTDSHKNKTFQPYAAATAAAYSKAFLSEWAKAGGLTVQPPGPAEANTQAIPNPGGTAPVPPAQHNVFSGTFSSGRNMYHRGTFHSGGVSMNL
ncbi:hypothetical protein DV736_g6699, partial [Chaetothyriales sp. CBS 134916]